jgi:hypothetical protein
MNVGRARFLVTHQNSLSELLADCGVTFALIERLFRQFGSWDLPAGGDQGPLDTWSGKGFTAIDQWRLLICA